MKLPLYQPDAANSTRFLFFTGKGGVGKTSLSCATALKLVEAGKRVLLVSTDPASNLDEVLETKLTNAPTPIAGAPGLDAMNINPVEAAAAYRERLIGPMRGLLPEAALRSMEEQLSGSCTVEIAAFDEFSGLIGNPQAVKKYDHVIFDTAPTGHTLRLMSLAKAWDQFLDPPPTSKELRAIGVGNQCLVVNGTFETKCPEDVTAQAMQQRGLSALTAASEFIDSMPSFLVPLRPINILGIGGLRVLLDGDGNNACVTKKHDDWTPPEMESLEDLVTAIEKQGHGVIMTMGKGGVGKTTVAAAIAVMLARRGHSVHLSTTDPAAHVAQTLAGQVDRLTLSKIDPALETAAYQDEVMRAQGAGMDQAGRALLEEDLRSPCTEEIAVFRAFAREVGQGTNRFVVLDTAPTGHTLLLLDASEAYQRELERQARSTQPEEVLRLLERLRDPAFTRILLVTLPEATPVHEAAMLQEDLRRARIEPFAWVINQSLLHSGSCDPLLQCREESEHRYLREVVEKHATRTAWLSWQPEEPIGPYALTRLVSSNRQFALS
ncbi:MAG: TRC40/GET3/ArsA family transport-energizing ATPase [Verrucomicrobia bacterium]|nr:TRC40/GET3/ArsA family transport-energizing ATPase [Verrucomicrobiota bacterium]